MRGRDIRLRIAFPLLLASSLLPTACSGQAGGRPRHGGMMGGGMMGGGMPMMMGRARADTAAAPRPVAAAAESTGVCPAVTQPAVDRGREIFGTRGNCYACHGPDAGGTAAAPDLRDAQWLDADGSYRSIIALVRSGVPHPKQYPAAMPPEGGAALSDAELCAVAAYVRSLAPR